MALACAGAVVLATGAAAQSAVERTERRPELTAQQLVDRAAADSWDTFTARVVVRRQLIGAGGQLVGPRMATDAREEFIWQRMKTSTGWKTTMTLVDGVPRTVRSLRGDVPLPVAPTVSRIEDAEDGTGPRLFDRAGVRLSGPSDALRARVGMSATGAVEQAVPGVGPGLAASATQAGTDVPLAEGRGWVRALIMSPADQPVRLRSMEQKFGRRVGLVRGLGRYVRDRVDPERGVVVHEALVDEQGGVPIEVNVMEGGALVSHSLFAYERAVTGAMVRRGVRIERLLSGSSTREDGALGRALGASGARIVSEVSYSDIRLEQKGGR